MNASISSKPQMTAVVYQRYGAPDELVIEKIDVPEASEGEVLVQVHASTVNRTDCGFLRGKPLIVRLFSGLRSPNDKILGCEFAGKVIELGEGVTGYKIGDRVVGFKDDDYGFGGHAEYTVMNVKGMLARIPKQFSYEAAAPALEGSHYAMHYIRAAGISKDHTVLINGTTGAIGSAALQIIKHMGAHVTAVCAGEHVALVRSLGADEVIDYQSEDFTKLDKQFDVVFDAVGKSTFGRCKSIMKPEGIYMSTELGPYSQNPFLALATRFIGKRKVLFPIPKSTQADAQYLCDLMAQGAYTPMVDRSYPLEEIADAYRYVEQGMKVGNVVIKIV